MTTQTTLETCQPESSTELSPKSVWRANISCPHSSKETNLMKEKFLLERLDTNRSNLHWKLVDIGFSLFN